MKAEIKRPKKINARHCWGASLLRQHNQEKEASLRKERMRVKREMTEYNLPESRKARREELRKQKQQQRNRGTP